MSKSGKGKYYNKVLKKYCWNGTIIGVNEGKRPEVKDGENSFKRDLELVKSIGSFEPDRMCECYFVQNIEGIFLMNGDKLCNRCGRFLGKASDEFVYRWIEYKSK